MTSDSQISSEIDLSCDYSANLPALLHKLNISIALTSYQTGRLILLRSDGQSLDVNYKSFHRPMGIAVSEGKITLGTFTQVTSFHREDGLIKKLKQPLDDIQKDITAPKLQDPAEPQPGIELEKRLLEPCDSRVDACFISRSSHATGMINIHDIAWGSEGLWAVNSSFSCLVTLDENYSFVPRWKPEFISDLKPEDRCHLNGMAMDNGKPAYVTTFSKLDNAGLWRQQQQFDGTLIDVQNNRIVLDGLCMPHSPRCHQGQVYFCDSGYGTLCRFDPVTERKTELASFPGFTRGMDFYGPLLFLGLSRIRSGDVSRPAPLAEKYTNPESGLRILNLQGADGKIEEVAQLKFTGDLDQIYDVAVIPDCHFPEIIEPSHPRMRNHFCHPTIQPMED